jgi:hypothetical protein
MSMASPTTSRATKGDALRRWLIAGLVAGLAVPSALWTERRAISRRITIARLRGGTQGFVSLAEQEVGALCALAATFGGLLPIEPSFTAYARPLIQRAAGPESETAPCGRRRRRAIHAARPRRVNPEDRSESLDGGMVAV